MGVEDPTAVELEIINARNAYRDANPDDALYGKDTTDDVGESGEPFDPTEIETRLDQAEQDIITLDGRVDLNDQEIMANTAYSQPSVYALTPTTGTANLSGNGYHNQFITHALSGDITYATVFRNPGKYLRVRISAGGSARNLTFPAWNWYAGSAPASIASGKTALLEVWMYDTTDANTWARWTVQP